MNIVETNNIETNGSFVEQGNFNPVEQGIPKEEDSKQNEPVFEVKDYTNTEKGLSNIPNINPVSDIPTAKEGQTKIVLPIISSLNPSSSNDWKIGMSTDFKQEIAKTF